MPFPIVPYLWEASAAQPVSLLQRRLTEPSSRPRARLFRIGTGRVGQRTAVAQRRSPLHGTGLPVSSFSCGFSPFGAERFSGRVQLPALRPNTLRSSAFRWCRRRGIPKFHRKKPPSSPPGCPRWRSLLPQPISFTNRNYSFSCSRCCFVCSVRAKPCSCASRSGVFRRGSNMCRLIIPTPSFVWRTQPGLAVCPPAISVRCFPKQWAAVSRIT